MGRIDNYDKDHIVEAGDKVIGSNKNDGKTGNYDVEDIAKLAGNFTEFFPLNYKYADNTNTYTHETAGYFTANDNDFGLVTTLRFNKTSQLNEDVSDIFIAIKGDVDSGDKTVRIKVSATDISLAYGTYTVSSVTEFATYFQFEVSLYGTYYRGDLVNEKRYLIGSSSVDTSFGLDEVRDDATPELGGFLDENGFGVRSKVVVKGGVPVGSLIVLQDSPVEGIFYGASALEGGAHDGEIRIALSTGAGIAQTTLIRGVYNTTGLVTGDKYYLSESGFSWTNDTSGFADTSVIRYIGFALSTTKLYFDPSDSYVTKDGYEVNGISVGSGSSVSATGNYVFSTSTTPPPAPKSIIFNNATPASVTQIHVSITTNNNNDASAYLSAITTDTLIYIQDQRDATKYILAKATGSSVDNTTYFTIPVSIEDSGDLPANNAKISALISIGGGGGSYDDSWIPPALDLKEDKFLGTVTVTSNYSTASKNTDTKKTILMTTGTELQLTDTGLTVGFEQYFVNNTGSTVNIISTETVYGFKREIPNGGYARYRLINTNEWILTVYDTYRLVGADPTNDGWTTGSVGGYLMAASEDDDNSIVPTSLPIGSVVNSSFDMFLSPTEQDQAKKNIGLDNVDNTSDLDKPISTAAQAEFDGLKYSNTYLKQSNYSTANNQSEHKSLLVFDDTAAPYTVTLNDIGLTVEFEQQIFNDSGQDITIVSSESVLGSNIPLANGYFAYYKLIASNEWVLAVGGSGGLGGGAVDSVNGQTGAVVLDADDIDDSTTTNKFMSFEDITWDNLVADSGRAAMKFYNITDERILTGETYGRIMLKSTDKFDWVDPQGFTKEITIVVDDNTPPATMTIILIQ